MGTRDPRIDAYIADSADFARPILTHLREVVHAACPEAEETLKWSAPHFLYKGMLCGMQAFRAHCAFGFWKAPAGSEGREYVEWITEAKTEPTRLRRVDTTVEWLAEGTSRTWKYQGC
jgi:hypothetical protein